MYRISYLLPERPVLNNNENSKQKNGMTEGGLDVAGFLNE
jgi:hypothetical protein